MEKLPTGAVLTAASKISASSHSTLPMNSATAPLRQALADRLDHIAAIEAVGRMLTAFPNGAPADAKGYIGALAAVLREYPRQVALRCADPLRGVARETRFLPTVSDLVTWCERETEAMRKPVDTEDRYAALRAQSQERADEAAYWDEQRKTRPSLEEMQQRYGLSWGIVQAEQDAATREASARQLAEANERALLAEYAAAGLEPVRAGDGTLISLTLARMLHVQTEAAE